MLPSRMADTNEPRFRIKKLSRRFTHELQRILGITCQPVFTRVLNARKALPQLTLGHAQRLDQISRALKGHPGLFLTGAYFGGVGMPDCIETARRTARQAVDFVKSS